MKVKAVVSFAGLVCAVSGEVMDLPDGSPVLSDLLRAGYVEAERPATRKTTEVKKKEG